MSVNAATSRNLAGLKGTNRWAPIIGLSLVTVTIVLLYFDTLKSLIGIWLESDTYFHGFLILPISAYLVWRNRFVLRGAEFAVYAPGVLVLAVLSVGWWICNALGIQVGAHALLIAMLPAAVVTCLGPRFARVIAFPLAYLIFAVPFGDFLVPPLMEFTATFTVWALNITGVPVVRDGLYFSIPAGNFEVAAACSGIRYLLATLALAALYAYLSFDSARKRILFLALAIVVPIFANALRAYGIVMIAYLSEMRFAVGADHILYGWVFFGVVIAALFWIGKKFQDDHVNLGQIPSRGDSVVNQASATNNWKSISVVSLAIFVVSVGPTLQLRMTGSSAQVGHQVPSIPTVAAGWQLTSSPNQNWRPVFIGPSTDLLGKYTDGEVYVDLAVIQYENQFQGEEIVNARNSIADLHDWDLLRDERLSLPEVHGALREVRSVDLRGPVSRRVVWYWYYVNGSASASNLGVKILEGKNLVLGRSPVSTLVAISVQSDDSKDEARNVLADFLVTAIPLIEQCIREPATTPSCVRAGDSPVDF